MQRTVLKTYFPFDVFQRNGAEMAAIVAWSSVVTHHKSCSRLNDNRTEVRIGLA